MRFFLEISRAGCDVEIILRATDGRESYVITTDKSLSAGATILGEVKLQVNGQDATDMPTEVGLYNVKLVITDTVLAEKNLDWQLEITPFDSSDFSDIVN